MSRADDVLAECAANPDDDAPRLVWADLIGGERGELVVIQCELARGNVTQALRARERELLDAYGVEWAGELARHAWRWSYRRGFIEAATLRQFENARALEPWPLLSSITVRDLTRTTLAHLVRHDRLRALAFERRHPLRGDPLHVPKLRAFGVDHLDEADFDRTRQLVASAPIERLCLRSHMLGTDQVRALLDAAPRLCALELTSVVDQPSKLESVFARPLRAARLGRVRYRDLTLLPGTIAASTLERLAFDLVGDAPLLDDVLAACPKLRVVERRGEYGGHDELLHESPDALISLGPPCFERTPLACVARLDRREVFELAPRPIDEHLYFGRSRESAVCLPASTVARRHAELRWREGHHVLRDLGSTNGVYFEGARVDHVALRDGDTVHLGEVTLQYFVGDGCRERAEAAIGSSTP